MIVKNMKNKPKISEFKFRSFGRALVEGIQDYEFGELSSNNVNLKKEREDIIRIERKFEEKNKFSIDQKVREHRGIMNQEKTDWEKAVETEVISRLSKIEKQSYDDGFKKGFEDGFLKSKEEADESFTKQIDEFASKLSETNAQLKDVYLKNKLDSFRMVKNLSKWIILKEIAEDGYLERLLEKLILEINTKSNLVVRVNSKSFESMPEIIEKVQSRIGALTNVRIEVELDLKENGIILESENGIIDGSLQAQFASLDKMFETVGLFNDNNE